MTKTKIIAKLWSSIYDLMLYIKGTSKKSLEQIETDLSRLEYECRGLGLDEEREEREEEWKQ